MQHAEQHLKNAVMEDCAEESVTTRNRSQTITMSETEFLSCNLYYCRLCHTDHSKFLKIRIRPHIVVALKEIHLDSPVHQVLESRKHADISLRHHITILVPEIPNVSEKVQSPSILRQTAEKIHKTGFTTGRVGHLKS